MRVRQETSGKLLPLLLAVLFLLVFSGLAVADVVAVFGPKQYAKPPGKPVTHVDAFRIPRDVANCNLWLKNGKKNKDVVKDFSVSVNGVEVINSRNIRDWNAPIRVNIPDKQNTLKVSLRGEGGGYLTIGVVGERQAGNGNFTPPPRPAPVPEY